MLPTALTADDAAAACAPLPCSEVVAPMPFQLDFASDHGGLVDAGGTGTGFTYVDPPAGGGGYQPSRLSTGDGLLRIGTGPGIAYLEENSLENALAVGVPASARVFSVGTTIDTPARGTGQWEQGGIWIGIDQDNYLKLVVLSHEHRIGVEFLGESDGRSAFWRPGAQFARRFVGVRDLHTKRVELVMRADVDAGTVAAFYSKNGEDLIHVATFVPPTRLLTGGAAAFPGLAGSRLAGVLASHRLGPGPLEYRFDSFEVACHNQGCARSAPDPGSGGPKSPRRSPNPGSGGRTSPRRTTKVSGRAGSLRATLRHPRRMRIGRLVARGLPVVLRCNEECSMRARVRGSRHWGRTVGLVARRSGVAIGSGQAGRPSAGSVRTRLTVHRRMKGRVRRVLPARLTVETLVRAPDGDRVRLRSVVRVRR
jgi:hypothetical protein